MSGRFTSILFTGAAFAISLSTARAADPLKVLRKPIPDKLIVLTFDDAPASHATVVQPILKSLGLGASFYVCDFDSFRTRKDWYLTYRQMRSMADDGFEVGNHTRGHGGGLGNFLDMEDQLLAHDVPKPTTVCWPVYQVVWDICADLTTKGYHFGRGGHDRPYRPTVDHPFDIPSFSIQDNVSVETFIKHAQLASQGRIVVFTFHGVPDMEHPPVSLDPATFKVMMQYLKDNHYKAIALRDLAEFIDPVKAFKLPRTADDYKETEAVVPVVDDKPYTPIAAKDIEHFAFPGQVPVRRSNNSFTVTLPHATDVTALAPEIRVSPGATVIPAPGVRIDFTKPQTYTVTGKDGSKKTYSVTVKKTAASPYNDILSFALKNSSSASISGSAIGVTVPTTTDVTALAPTFTLSPFATAVPPSGTRRDFTEPQTYTVTAQDGSPRVYKVTVLKTDDRAHFRWIGPEKGDWSDAANWTSNRDAAAPDAAGRPDYTLTFNKPIDLALRNDLKNPFRLNQLNLLFGHGRGLNLSGNPLQFTANAACNLPPAVRIGSPFQRDQLAVPLDLAADLSINVREGSEMTVTGLISGSGGLVLNNAEPKPDADYHGDHPAVFRIDNPTNTYRGGTTVNAGSQLFLFVAKQGMGSGPVRLNPDGRLRLENVQGVTNPLTSDSGRIDGGGGWQAPVTLKGETHLSGNLTFQQLTGPGGLTLLGNRGPWGYVNEGEVVFEAANDYTGPTNILRGTLHLKKAVCLYHADAARWTPANIRVGPTATLRLAVGGPGEFTGPQVGLLAKNLTTSIADNGLTAGSVLRLDTANSVGSVVVPTPIPDSKGPGGGPLNLKKSGPGVLQLAEGSSYSGRTLFDAGTLVVSSLNRVVAGRPTSCLGAPTTVETGVIDVDGDCTLKYTGPGETTDRITDLTGGRQTLTLDQSGAGLLKFTSPFDISGYGHSKTLVLTGSAATAGEFAAAIRNPYDRKDAATTSLVKSGPGRWTLSAVNTFTGPTNVAEGVLALANPRALAADAELSVAAGATLVLDFKGDLKVRKLTLAGVAQAAGVYDAAAAPEFIKGPGRLVTAR